VKLKTRLIVLLAGVTCAGTYTDLRADVVRHPMNIGMSLEEFQLFDANQYQGTRFDDPLIMVRPTGWIFQSATINERLSLVVGVGATTFSLPHDSGSYPTGVYQNEVFPAVALVQASGSYVWGDLASPALTLTVGQMPYKYNPDAKNLGEYLFRSTPYPGTVLNSPFDLVNAAQANILAIVLNKNALDGKWKNDLLLTTATSSFPLYDFSLAYVTSYKLNPMLEVGAGVNLFRLIPVQPSITTNTQGDNAYFTYGGKDYSSNPGYYPAASADRAVSDSVNAALSTGAAMPAGASGVDYYTFKGQMLMARFALDLAPVLGANMAWKIYGEWAMLGVQNYPVFYEKPLERMPIMLGVTVPTKGFLDVLNVEAEYWKNPYLNSSHAASYGGVATPNFSQQSYDQAGVASFSDPVKDDDLKWSVTATKSMSKSLSITAKAANDHLQLMQYMQAGFPGKSYGDMMSSKGAWYYVLRFQVAI
jgi:hypothetical protein